MEPDGVLRPHERRHARARTDGPVHQGRQLCVHAPERDGRTLEGRHARPRSLTGRGASGLGEGHRIDERRSVCASRRSDAVRSDGAGDDRPGRGLCDARIQQLDESHHGFAGRSHLHVRHQGRAGALQRLSPCNAERQSARQAAQHEVHLRLRRASAGLGVRMAVLRAGQRFGRAGRQRLAVAGRLLRQAGRSDARLDHGRRRGRVRPFRSLRALPLPFARSRRAGARRHGVVELVGAETGGRLDQARSEGDQSVRPEDPRFPQQRDRRQTFGPRAGGRAVRRRHSAQSRSAQRKRIDRDLRNGAQPGEEAVHQRREGRDGIARALSADGGGPHRRTVHRARKRGDGRRAQPDGRSRLRFRRG